jgi:hypothetical protein
MSKLETIALSMGYPSSFGEPHAMHALWVIRSHFLRFLLRRSVSMAEKALPLRSRGSTLFGNPVLEGDADLERAWPRRTRWL